jgi:hypothetical protein
MRLELATEICRLAAPIYAVLLADVGGNVAAFTASSAWRRAAMQTAINQACELKRMALESHYE